MNGARAVVSQPSGGYRGGRTDNSGNRGRLGGVDTDADGFAQAIGGRISTETVDAEALARVLSGDRDAYAELVRRHAPVATRTAVLLGAGSDADDVVQEAFVKAYRSLGRFREGAAFRPWLLRIVANETHNQRRTSRRRSGQERSAALLTDGLLASSPDPAVSAESVERREELLAVVRNLSEPHRLVVTCRYLLDLDEQETATVLGWPRGTVKSRLHRALRRLHHELESRSTTRRPVRQVHHGD